MKDIINFIHTKVIKTIYFQTLFLLNQSLFKLTAYPIQFDESIQ